MSVLEDARVTRGGREGFLVSISHGCYLVVRSYLDGFWWAYSDGARLRPLNAAYPATDPLACSSDACSGWETPDELIAVLLSFDGEELPA